MSAPSPVFFTLILVLLLACLCSPSAASSLRPLNTTALPGSPTYATPYESVRGIPYTVTYDERALVINNVRTLLLSGSIHYPRFATAEWAHQFEMARLAGLNTVQTYVFWNWHEPARRQYDFESEGHQLTYFLDLVSQPSHTHSPSATAVRVSDRHRVAHGLLSFVFSFRAGCGLWVVCEPEGWAVHL